MIDIPVGDVDLAATLAGLALVPRDPTVRVTPDRFARATVTPDGPDTIVITWDAPGTARVQTAGDGADWLAEHAPGLLGCHDDVSGLEPAGQPVRELWRRHRRQRIARTGTLWHDLAWLISNNASAATTLPSSGRVSFTPSGRRCRTGWCAHRNPTSSRGCATTSCTVSASNDNGPTP